MKGDKDLREPWASFIDVGIGAVVVVMYLIAFILYALSYPITWIIKRRRR